MEPREYHAAIGRETTDLAAVVRTHQRAAVPSCPGWTVGDLVVHLGVTQRWAAETVRTRAAERVRGAIDRWGRKADDPGLGDWLDEGAAELVAALEAADLDAPVWAFTGSQPTRFWSRRMANEAAVHRWDGQLATGDARPIDADLAADGVDEVLTAMGSLRRMLSKAEGAGETVHLHRTDGDGEWLVRFEGTGMTVERAHGKGDLALRGPASDLLLFLWHRTGVEHLEVFGDAALVERWFELLPPL